MKILIQLILILLVLLLNLVSASAQKTVRYDLYIGDTLVNYSGKEVRALSVNSQIPGPVLTFTEGDTAEIYVHNTLQEETSIHWHGIILPNQYDGVPYLTSSPIKSGETHLYKFPLLQNGTYWYHSHTMLQEQDGLYGAFIIKKRQNDSIPEYPLLLSDWTDMNPKEVHRSLHNANDWFAIQKGSTQNYWQAIREGYLKTKVINEWKRMLAMDVSDVYYNTFLSNGHFSTEYSDIKPGKSVRLRIINGSASTYFWIRFAGGKIKVVANDGIDVVPVEVDRMLIAVSETYDIIVTLPDSGSYELQSTSEDRTKYTSLWIGQGEKHKLLPLPKLKYFEGMKMMNSMMTTGGKMNDMGMQMSNQQMDMNIVMYPELTGVSKFDQKKKDDNINTYDLSDPGITLNYSMLKSPEVTTLPETKESIYHFELTGNMNRYVWSINNKTVSETDKILIRQGEKVKIILYNNSMMRHPMHLHGHFFRLLNGQGEYSPLKNVVDIMPMETDTLEFAATESGDWFFHCHILYHMMSGMGRIFSYENSAPNPQIPDPEMAIKMLYKDDRAFHAMLHVDLASNGSDGEFMIANTRWKFQTEWRLGLNHHHGYETEAHFGRYFGRNQFLFTYLGYDFRYRKLHSGEIEENIFKQTNSKDERTAICAGIQYTLPLLIIADIRIDSDYKFRFQLMREDIALSSRLRLQFMGNSDLEYMVGLKYIATKYISITTHYDSDMGIGAGLSFTY